MKFVDLFCGAGFGARGASKGGGTPLLGVDAWKLATQTYQNNFKNAEVICSRIENINPWEVAERHKPDVLLTSPECTSHSIARGNKPGCDRSKETAIGIVPWLKALKPRWLIVENVNRMKKWDRHNELVMSIEKEGYTVNDLYLDASQFGTPQARKRMFLICDKGGEIISQEDLLSSHNRSKKNANSIIDWEGNHKSTPLYKPGRAKATLERAERAIEVLGKDVPFLIVYYGSDYAGGWQTLGSPLRTVTTLDRFGLVTWKNGEPLLRMLQPIELLQAMGVGKTTHKLNYGSRRDKVKLCGNGVCAPVMDVIFKKINKLSDIN